MLTKIHISSIHRKFQAIYSNKKEQTRSYKTLKINVYIPIFIYTDLLATGTEWNITNIQQFLISTNQEYL